MPVLPPILANGKDILFLNNLNQSITDELSQLVIKEDPQERFTIHRNAFCKVIEYLDVYRPMLNNIKAEYEEHIKSIRQSQHEAFFLAGKLNQMANAPTTLKNYKKRNDDLENKLSVIRNDNERLEQEVNELKLKRKMKNEEKRINNLTENTKKEIEINNCQRMKQIPGLTVDQLTDHKLLSSWFKKLEKNYKELNLSYHTRYSSKTVKDDLKEELSTVISLREQLSEEMAVLQERQLKLMVAVQSAQAYLKIQPPDQTIGQAVLAGLARQANNMDGDTVNDDYQHSSTTEDDDPCNDKETEEILDYIETFNELIENKKYKEAAIHAANSIKGVLRTQETMQRFKDLIFIHEIQCHPLLTFCEALISTVPAFGIKPNGKMSETCVECALQEKRLDLLTHWLSQERLTLTKKMADMIFKFSMETRNDTCLSLAQKVYVDTLSHASAMICLVSRGRVNQALQYADINGCTVQDLLGVFHRCPDLKFAIALYKRSMEQSIKKVDASSLPIGHMAITLEENSIHHEGLYFIKKIYTDGLQEFGDCTTLQKAVSGDATTSEEEWMNIVQLCFDNGLNNCANGLLAAVTVAFAVNRASSNLETIITENDIKN